MEELNLNQYLFTSEAVSEGHPDKVADQISDALLDAYLAKEPTAHVAIETLVTHQTVVLSGEVKAGFRLNHTDIVREVIRKIGYNDASTGFSADGVTVLDLIHDQSKDIDMGVTRKRDYEQGAGDQGMMFGYATSETETYIPATLYIANVILQVLADLRKQCITMKYLRPDSKAQVTIMYDNNNVPLYVTDVVVSTQHDEFASQRAMQEIIDIDIRRHVMPKVKKRIGEKLSKLFTSDTVLHVNPTGNFVHGGPSADTGLTGRKIIVDTYGGRGAHGGGAFSGKDPSKVDRSGAYMARYIAKNIVAARVAKECLVQLAYVIGEKEPVSVCVNTYGTAHSGITDSDIANFIKRHYNLSPYAIEKVLSLREVKYLPTASYGHFGRKPTEDSFTWEDTKEVEQIRFAFDLDV